MKKPEAYSGFFRGAVWGNSSPGFQNLVWQGIAGKKRPTFLGSKSSVLLRDAELSRNSVYRAGIHASTAVDAGVRVDGALAASFANGINRAGIITGAAVDALVINGVSHFYSPPS